MQRAEYTRYNQGAEEHNQKIENKENALRGSEGVVLQRMNAILPAIFSVHNALIKARDIYLPSSKGILNLTNRRNQTEVLSDNNAIDHTIKERRQMFEGTESATTPLNVLEKYITDYTHVFEIIDYTLGEDKPIPTTIAFTITRGKAEIKVHSTEENKDDLSIYDLSNLHTKAEVDKVVEKMLNDHVYRQPSS